MKIREILEIENKNTDSINLFREGLFWRCYEYSAWRFVKNIKDYRLIKRFVKIVDQDIVYLGFVDNTLPEILEKANKSTSSHIQKSDSLIIIQGFAETEGYMQWKEGIMPEPEKRVASTLRHCSVDPGSATINNKQEINMHEEVILKIKQYPIINKTPVEAFNFLGELQKELHGNL